MAPGDREVKSFLYTLTRVVMKLGLWVFFTKIEVRHAEYVPATGPALFVANHPNSIMDALVMGVVTKRKVNYIGHAGLFSNTVKSWFLRSTGVIPVYRREDAPDKANSNESMFEACFRTLEQGETIGIFPEGTSDMLRKVKQIRTGAARIALESERRNGYQLSLTLLPVGLYFFSRTRFRSRVLVNLGRPIPLTAFFEMNEKDNTRAVQALTDEIQRSLKCVTVNVQDEELDDFVRDVEALYREDLQKETFGIMKASKRTIAEFVLIQKIAECVQYYHQVEPERLARIRNRVNEYKRKLRRLHLRDVMLKEQMEIGSRLRDAALSLARLVVGLPLALYGTCNNLAPYLLTEAVARRFVNERTKVLSALLLGGGAVFAFFYVAQTLTVWYLSGRVWAACYLASLPLSGLFALSYIKHVRRQHEQLMLTLFLLTNRDLFNKVMAERRRLMVEFNAIRDEYMKLSNIDGVSRAQAAGD